MTVYCAGETKATVDFKLGAVKDSVVIEKNLPVTVDVQSNPPNSYKFRYQFRGCPGNRGESGCWTIGANYPNRYPWEIGNQPSEGDFFVSIFTLSGEPIQESGNHSQCPVCGIVRVRDSATGEVILGDLSSVSWEPVPCSITIKDSTGATVFSRSGDCPVSFTVSCGDECPEGYCKCPTLKYPGYCCCKCSNH